MKKGLSVLMGVLFFGSIWGVLEATMGNILHFIGLHPYTGMIMTSIGIGLMGFARKLYRFRGIGIIMGIIAGMFKAVDFLVPGSNVIRPIAAILIVAFAFEAVTWVADRFKSSIINDVITGLSSGYLAITGFAYFTAYVLKFHYWLNKGFIGIAKYIVTDGWMFGAGSTIAYLIGSNLNEWSDKILNIQLERIVDTKPFYAVSAVFTLACFIFVVVV